MDYFKEVFEFLSKAKDVRLNLALFLASTSILTIVKKEIITISESWTPILELITFLTFVRIIAKLLSLTWELVEKHQAKKNLEKETTAQQIKEHNDQQKKRSAIASSLNNLDIHQLKIIQDLKKTNTITVSKGASLYMLKNMDIVIAAATGPHSESVKLSRTTDSIMNDGMWDEFETLKLNSATRFFKGLGDREAEAFKYFLEHDRRVSKRKHGYAWQGDWDYPILSEYRNSILFLQPQSGYTFEIDKTAKFALRSVFGIAQHEQISAPENNE